MRLAASLARARFRVLALALPLAAACSGGGDDPPTTPEPTGGTPAAARDTVTMLPAAFVPPFVTVKVGQSVAWDFAGSLDHNVIFARRTGAPGDILPTRNRVVTRRFDTAGTFPYQCTLHNGMTGEVAVER